MLIGEVARRSGVSVRMLRHYDKLGIAGPTGRTSGGYRDYAEADLQRLVHVESLRSLGLPLADVARALDDPGFSPAHMIGELRESICARIAADTELLRRLDDVREAGPEDWGDALQVVALLREVRAGSGAGRQQALLRHGGAGVPETALAEALLRERDPNAAGALRWVLAKGSGAAIAVLERGLESGDAEVRRRAVTGIAEIGGPRADPALRSALDHFDDEVRQRAALAVAAAGDARAVPFLVRMVHEGWRDVAAAEVLGALVGSGTAPDHEVVGALVDTAEAETAADGDGHGPDSAARGRGAGNGPGSGGVALRVVQALAEIDGTPARRALEDYARHGARTVAATADVILRR